MQTHVDDCTPIFPPSDKRKKYICCVGLNGARNVKRGAPKTTLTSTTSGDFNRLKERLQKSPSFIAETRLAKFVPIPFNRVYERALFFSRSPFLS
ncbi:hypothetical protein PUN28_006214 [Cardiocondyla obscurior]|uniref:Uncharacterized protein n=1 Tax=Cardiocondyla obscurior TaxID=286306 RepID=A0AAW2GAG5_9HYME